MRIFILPILLFLGMPTTSISREILVITGKDSQGIYLDKKNIVNIFLRKQLINQKGKRWIPVNLSTSHPLRRAFSETLFEQQPEEMDNYWNIKYFHGISPPYVVDSQQAMLSFVTSTPNAIGYISPCFVNDDITIIFKLMLKNKVKLDFKQACKDSIELIPH